MRRRLTLSLLVVSLSLAGAAAPAGVVHACGGYGRQVRSTPAQVVRQHYAVMRGADPAALSPLWRADATYVFDHRGCCMPPTMAALPTLRAEMGVRVSTVIESVSAPQVNADRAHVTVTVRRGAQRFVERFGAAFVDGVWVLTSLTRSVAYA